MGLKEKRAVKEFEDNVLPKLRASLNEIAGFDVEMEIDFDVLAEDDMGHLYSEAWPSIFFTPVEKAFKQICSDDLGKGALKDCFKKLVVTNKSDVFGQQSISFADGVLTIDHKPFSNIDDVNPRAKWVQEALEKGL
jgi:hypothetical protein